MKAHLSELVGRVHTQHQRITVAGHGQPSAVLVAPGDLESLEETIAILSDPDHARATRGGSSGGTTLNDAWWSGRFSGRPVEPAAGVGRRPRCCGSCRCLPRSW
ncbi:type II toxin-antitoxin system Phd/YefM family antitoxin [Rhodococcus ruber]|uniref:type II toxin-antitoxin system Phd/YefM family antitoxin n=1 Tax=Rhodococcus ruber TaxID=1830 RepID=UPI00315D1303